LPVSRVGTAVSTAIQSIQDAVPRIGVTSDESRDDSAGQRAQVTDVCRPGAVHELADG
jgi:hypothetical protein